MAQKPSSSTGQNHVTRRAFIRDAGAVAATLTVPAISGAYSQVKDANDRIGVGIIGCGGRGNGHLGILRRMKDSGANIEIVAVCDVYRPRLDKAATTHYAKAYMDHRELLADSNVDVVGIATPDHIHGYQVIDAVRAGKDVYCEKPVTHWRQFELTKKLFYEVKKSGRVFQLGTQGMSDSAWHQMKKLVKGGLIGQPIHAECGYFRVGDWGERGMRIDDGNARPGKDLRWDAFLGDSPSRPFDVSRFFRWRMYEDYSGGPVTDLFPHSLTPVISVLGVSMPSSVVATGGRFRYQEREIPDTFNMLADYPEKITVAVLGTQGNDYQATGRRGAGRRIPVIRGWDGALTIEGLEIVFVPAKGSDKEAGRFAIEHKESLVRHWENLLSCCRTGQQPYSPVDLAYHVQTALQMGTMGFRASRVARFDRTRECIVL